METDREVHDMETEFATVADLPNYQLRWMVSVVNW